MAILKMRNCRSLLTALAAALSLFAAPSAFSADAKDDLEETVCGSISERLAFLMWRSAAGKPNPGAAARVSNAEPIIHLSRDGRSLRGYKLKGSTPEGKSKGALLVAQGNAMLADQLLATLAIFASTGLDVYIFDYRGYGDSEGNPRLKAIVSDYHELYESVGASTQGARLLYGISFGGVVLLNVIGSGVAFDRAAIDSSPSRVSNLGCPERYDPVMNVPGDGSRLFVIAGSRDKVVVPEDSIELLDLAKSRGARTEIGAELAHPFMDASREIHRLRIESIASFLAGSAK